MSFLRHFLYLVVFWDVLSTIQVEFVHLSLVISRFLVFFLSLGGATVECVGVSLFRCEAFPFRDHVE